MVCVKQKGNVKKKKCFFLFCSFLLKEEIIHSPHSHLILRTSVCQKKKKESTLFLFKLFDTRSSPKVVCSPTLHSLMEMDPNTPSIIIHSKSLIHSHSFSPAESPTSTTSSQSTPTNKRFQQKLHNKTKKVRRFLGKWTQSKTRPSKRDLKDRGILKGHLPSHPLFLFSHTCIPETHLSPEHQRSQEQLQRNIISSRLESSVQNRSSKAVFCDYFLLGVYLFF